MKLSKFYPEEFKPNLVTLVVVFLIMMATHRGDRYVILTSCIASALYLLGSYVVAVIKSYYRGRKQANDVAVQQIEGS